MSEHYFEGNNSSDNDIASLEIENGNETMINTEVVTRNHVECLNCICRVCGAVKFISDDPKLKVFKHDLGTHMRKLYEVDAYSEHSSVYPSFICLSCEKRMKRFYPIIMKKKKCSFSKDSLASFVPHNGDSCQLCALVEEHFVNLANESVEELVLPEHEVFSSGDGSQSNNDTETELTCELRRYPVRERVCNKWLDLNLKPPSASKKQNTTDDTNMHVDDCQQVGALDDKDYSNIKYGKSDSKPSTSQTTDDSNMHIDDNAIPSKDGRKKKSGINKKIKSKETMRKRKNTRYIKKKKLKPLQRVIDKFSGAQKLKKVDLLFYLLVDALKESEDKIKECQVRDIWYNRSVNTLSQEQCLAMRVLLKLTKDSYRRQYKYYKEKVNKCVLKPPGVIDKLEKSFFPKHVDFSMTSEMLSNVLYQHKSCTSGTLGLVTKPELNQVVYVRWDLCYVLAKTLQEISHLKRSQFGPETTNVIINVIVKDHFEEKNVGIPASNGSSTKGSGRPYPALKAKLLTHFCTVASVQVGGQMNGKAVWEASDGAARPVLRVLYGTETANDADMTEDSMQSSQSCSDANVYHKNLSHKVSSSYRPSFSSFWQDLSTSSIATSNASPLVILKGAKFHSLGTGRSGTARLNGVACDAPESVSVLLKLLQEERERLSGKVLHITCPTTGNVNIFRIMFAENTPDVVKKNRNTSGLMKRNSADEGLWLSSALCHLRQRNNDPGSISTITESGKEAKEHTLDMARLWLSSSPRLLAAGAPKIKRERKRKAPEDGIPGSKRVRRKKGDPQPSASGIAGSADITVGHQETVLNQASQPLHAYVQQHAAHAQLQRDQDINYAQYFQQQQAVYSQRPAFQSTTEHAISLEKLRQQCFSTAAAAAAAPAPCLWNFPATIPSQNNYDNNGPSQQFCNNVPNSSYGNDGAGTSSSAMTGNNIALNLSNIPQ